MLHPNTRIVTCGGAKLEDTMSMPLHRAIVRMAGMKRPRALLIPTASGDVPEAREQFEDVYGERLGCVTDTLHLKQTRPSQKAIRDAIDRADIIYVGGGNTLMMMRRWRALGVDRHLLRAHQRGAVLAGSSAGAICWYEYGHSDSMWYYHPDDWDYIRVRCLGIIPATACPHVHSEDRMEHFQAMIAKHGGLGLAIDDHCAIAYQGDSYKLLPATPESGAYRVYKREGVVVTEPVPCRKHYAPLAELIER